METHLAITPSHVLDPDIAIAASRAGETGILDLGRNHPNPSRKPAIDRLAESVGPKAWWGVRWDVLEDVEERGPSVLADILHSSIPVLVLAGVPAPDAKNVLDAVRPLSEKVLLEACSLDAALKAQGWGYDGVILKSNEAGGDVGSQSAFVLLQNVFGRLGLPFWLQGGMGIYTAAAAMLAGAAGVVLCEQLWLTEEAPFKDVEKRLWQHLDGSETFCIGIDHRSFRFFSRTARKNIHELERVLAEEPDWKSAKKRLVAFPDGEPIIPCGQDVGLAYPLANRFGTTGGIFTALRRGVVDQLSAAESENPFREEAPLAKDHGTRYPVVQGPMANVSDVTPFCRAVADAGALPFFALSALPGPQVRETLQNANPLLDGAPWGVGILGFLPAKLRQEQFEVIQCFKPPFAIIAGGRPSQAAEFEKAGISTYLHVPSPGLLKTFLKEGSNQFIFEGRECGGHVGPLNGFVLWESVIHILWSLEEARAGQIRVLFAGGIHDELSAAMVRAISAPLLEKRVVMGIQMGTAYLFSTEAVQSRAITPEYQRQALQCQDTVLLQSGVGHASCCIRTPFIDKFYDKKQELLRSGLSDAEILQALEMLNLGRLKIAAKGIECRFEKSHDVDHVKHVLVEQLEVNEETQRNEGVFMIGQIARFHEHTFTMQELHAAVTSDGFEYFEAARRRLSKPVASVGGHVPIAIVGMSAMMPDAGDVREFWRNIVNGVSAIREVPPDRWDPEVYFEASRLSREKTYSKWGGFLKEVFFDPVKYGIAPRSLSSIASIQLLSLESAWEALEDAGYHRRDFPRKRTSVIFGAGGTNTLGIDYAVRSRAEQVSKIFGDVPGADQARMIASIREQLPEWTEDSFPGILANIVSGRIANRLNLGGSNFTVEAACATSLAALEVAVRQLDTVACDLVLVGAVDLANDPLSYIMFSRTQVLSPSGQSRPLDNATDGIVLSEGVATLVLKRLRDAERDGDRIYGVIRGVGSSSDGRNRSLTAPHPEGQIRAMKRAYRSAGIDPDTVELLELHGTGTVIGDKVEFESSQTVFGRHRKAQQYCAIGSVKSNIGHTKMAAGNASIIKAALALHHKVFPPTINVSNPNTRIDFKNSPFFISTECRPWLNPKSGAPRRAGVNSFGFGGTNFHVILEAYEGEYRRNGRFDFMPRDAEPVVLNETGGEALRARIGSLLPALEHPERFELAQLAYSLFLDAKRRKAEHHGGGQLTIVATSVEDLASKLRTSLERLATGASFKDPSGIYYTEGRPGDAPGGVCFLFPGQGSQRVNMFRDFALSLPEARALVEAVDRLLEGRLAKSLSQYIYPLPVFSEAERNAQQAELSDTRVAQPAMGLADLMALGILGKFGLDGEFLAGHSYGENVALCAAGALSLEDMLLLSEARGRLVHEGAGNGRSGMAAIAADAERVSAVIQAENLEVVIANLNGPSQTVVGGKIEAVEAAVPAFKRHGLQVRQVPVTAAFHTPAMEPIRPAMLALLNGIDFKAPKKKVYSNTTAKRYPKDPAEVGNLLTDHVLRPVRFQEQIRQMYRDGARTFIEVGPGRVLTGLVESILAGSPHAALSMNVRGRSDWVQLAILLAEADSLGLAVDFGPWFEGRGLAAMDTEALMKRVDAVSRPGPMVWSIKGGRAFPVHPDAMPAKAQQIQADSAAGTAYQPPNPETPSIHPTRPAPAAATPTRVLQATDPLQERSPKMNSLSQDHGTQNTGQFVVQSARDPFTVLQHCNHAIMQFLDLQQEQQRTAQQFIAMQEKILNVAAGRDSDGPAVLAPVERPLLTPPQSDTGAYAAPAEAAFVTHGVPPSPTIPRLPQVEAPRPAQPPPNADAPPDWSPPPPQQDVHQARSKQAKTSNIASMAPSPEQFQEKLLQIVSEKTGFPPDMLGLDMNMEADLGIDSIKKVEIFSTLRDEYEVMKQVDEEQLIEQLAALTTLNAIISWYGEKRAELTAGGRESTSEIQAETELAGMGA